MGEFTRHSSVVMTEFPGIRKDEVNHQGACRSCGHTRWNVEKLLSGPLIAECLVCRSRFSFSVVNVTPLPAEDSPVPEVLRCPNCSGNDLLSGKIGEERWFECCACGHCFQLI